VDKIYGASIAKKMNTEEEKYMRSQTEMELKAFIEELKYCLK